MHLALEVLPPKPRHDHSDVLLNGYFVGWESLKPEKKGHVNLQRCPRCKVGNYIGCVTAGVCWKCGLDINNEEQVQCFLESSTQLV